METLLPARPRVEIPTGDDVEEVNLMDYDGRQSQGRGGRSEAYHDDDEDGEGHGHPRMQCQHQ